MNPKETGEGNADWIRVDQNVNQRLIPVNTVFKTPSAIKRGEFDKLRTVCLLTTSRFRVSADFETT
jgi:hypothetical protein